MPRRKPTSTNQKKADQQLKRAVRRGEVPPPEPKKPLHRRRRLGPTGKPIDGNDDVIRAARKLQSHFIQLPAQYLERTRLLASTLPLQRPISDDKTIFRSFGQSDIQLTCPKRPKWRFDMTKIEVEHNEEGVFNKWIAQTDDAVKQWQGQPLPDDVSTAISDSPSYYERNLEVWRQLWRVSEISQILLVLLDSRCPLLHYPPSLADVLSDRKVILVLTKVDISGPSRADAWSKYLRELYPSTPIVQVESYIEKPSAQGRTLYEPSLPDHFRAKLVDAIKQVHAELCQPPEKVKNNPKWLATWHPPVKTTVDWDDLLHNQDEKLGSTIGGPAAPRPDGDETNEHDHEPKILTVGLIGQPNVGKSSLLNAIFGARRVRASKTAGKTKHFQTLYWIRDVRLVDCPGLVVPNFVPMEMQVLCGILPIARVSAVPSCTLFASELLPLERVLKLTHPSINSPPPQDKRTWRKGMKPEQAESSQPTTWTAMDILTAYADAKGWITAKAGRPDIHRAGNAILRALAEGRIGWGFWPPNTPLEEIHAVSGGDEGIWIPRADSVDMEFDQRDEEAEEAKSRSDVEEDVEELSEDESSDDEGQVPVGTGRFGALVISDGEPYEGEQESEDDASQHE